MKIPSLSPPFTSIIVFLIYFLLQSHNFMLICIALLYLRSLIHYHLVRHFTLHFLTHSLLLHLLRHIKQNFSHPIFYFLPLILDTEPSAT